MKLKEKYNNEVVPALREKFAFANINQVPKLVKVVLNVGVGRQTKEQGFIDNVVSSLQRISGQRPVRTKSKKSVSAFKIREGQIIGVKVSIRHDRMFDFLEKLINVSFPRIRDFRGISIKGVDDKGNLTIGFKEHVSFPEIRADEIDNIHGLEICIATTAKTKEEGKALFKLLGFPFKPEESK